jgi:hypothetical protein
MACGGGGGSNIAFTSQTTPTYTAFAESGAMSTNRSAFCATVLADGRVLVTGGYDATRELDSAEIWDPAGNGGLGSFTLLSARMAVTRYRHTATLLPSGKVLITGGRDASFASRSTAELFDPSANGGAGGFQTLAHAMTSARAEHVATALKDGRVLLTGGSSGSVLASAETFDPATNHFTATGPLHYVRIHHTATLLDSGKVLITGGDQGGLGSSAELFDPAAASGLGAFSDLPPMAVSRYFHAAALLKNGQVLITGGSNGGLLFKTDLFNPMGNGGAGTMAPSVDMAAGRSGHAMAPLQDGRCLIVGGAVSSPTLDSRSTEWYDPALNVGSGGFQAGPSLIYGRSGHLALRLPSGAILVLGGGQTKAELMR